MGDDDGGGGGPDDGRGPHDYGGSGGGGGGEGCYSAAFLIIIGVLGFCALKGCEDIKKSQSDQRRHGSYIERNYQMNPVNLSKRFYVNALESKLSWKI